MCRFCMMHIDRTSCGLLAGTQLQWLEPWSCFCQTSKQMPRMTGIADFETAPQTLALSSLAIHHRAPHSRTVAVQPTGSMMVRLAMIMVMMSALVNAFLCFLAYLLKISSDFSCTAKCIHDAACSHLAAGKTITPTSDEHEVLLASHVLYVDIQEREG